MEAVAFELLEIYDRALRSGNPILQAVAWNDFTEVYYMATGRNYDTNYFAALGLTC